MLAVEQLAVAGRSRRRRARAGGRAGAGCGVGDRARRRRPTPRTGLRGGTSASARVAARRPRSDLTIRPVLVCTLGDLTLDVIVRLAGPIAAGADTPAQTHLSAGGQAANVARGLPSSVLGRDSSESGGTTAASPRAASRHAGSRSRGLPKERAVSSARSSTRTASDRCLDRGSATAFRPDELDPRWLEGCDHLFVSGYALFDGPTRATARTAVELARARGAAVSASTWLPGARSRRTARRRCAR